MREPARRRRLARACAAALAVGVFVGAPGALAQTDEPDVDEPEVDDPDVDDPDVDDPDQDDPTEEDPGWSDSEFDEPLTSSPAVLERSSFPISGTFVHSIYDVTEVHVDFGRSSGGFSDADSDACVPDDPTNPVAGPQAEDAEEQAFAVDGVTWPCNGDFAVRARAQGEGSVSGSSEHVMQVIVSLRAPPPPVSSVEGSAAGGAVTISWTAQDPSPDAAGYRVERAGPKADDDSFGSFDEVGSVAVDTTSIEDSPDEFGEYRYRVRALRDSGGGLASPVHGTPVADVTVGSTSDTSGPSVGTPAGAGGGSRSSFNVPRSTSNPRPPSSGPPTTLDTGFQTELDYGDRPLDDSDELAAEGGQSIIRTDGDGVGMAAPAAGALVLLGWAGHIFYLNRLAKQF